MYPTVFISAVICANQKCRKLTLSVALGRMVGKENSRVQKPIEFWRLVPASAAKPQPDFIPKQIRDDYYEACAIRD